MAFFIDEPERLRRRVTRLTAIAVFLALGIALQLAGRLNNAETALKRAIRESQLGLRQRVNEFQNLPLARRSPARSRRTTGLLPVEGLLEAVHEHERARGPLGRIE